MIEHGIATPAWGSPSLPAGPAGLEPLPRGLCAVLESALDCIILTDEAGRILEWNPAAERCLGHLRADVLGRVLEDVILPAKQRAGHARQVGRRRELAVVRADGTELPVELALTRAEVRGHPLLLCIVRDLSERDQVAVREAAERAERLARATKDIIWFWDLASGQVIRNDAVQTVFRYPGGEVGDSFDWWCDRIHPEDRERVKAGIQNALERKREAWADEYRFLRGDGTYATVLHRGLIARNEQGEPVRMIGSFLDLTERRNIEQMRLRLAALVESSQDAIIGLTIDGLVEQWNAGAERLFGYQAQEATGQSILSLIIPEDKHAHVRELIGRLQRGQEIPPFESVRRRKDGRLVDVSITMSPIPEPSGEVKRISSILRDISERRRMQSQLEQAERLASVGTLAAGVAHEINNPLAYVLANLGFALEALQGRLAGEHAGLLGEVLDALREAQQGATRVKHIVRDLRLFARADEEQVGPVDVHQVIDSSINMVWGEIRHRARLTKDYGAIPQARANESRLAQVMINLLVNAAQAIREGAAEQNEIRVSTRADAQGQVVIEVRDTGAGIAPHHLPRIFDPFFTTKPVGVGTGLGLAICHGIVSALGGQIQVESAPGRGASFQVVLPGVSTPAAARATAPPATLPAGPRRARVLVIDDEPALLATLQRSLGKELELVVQKSGREALALLERDQAFDHILCDLMMPEVTGMDLYEQLHVRERELAERIVFMTGGAFTPRTRDFLARVANRLIEKPFDLGALRALLLAPAPAHRKIREK